ncbi:Uma2 family endonuclease [Mangrovibrevibacter kandeliae]|uniref:Uma2 family endonuclease n=1 Tax=Mangrovibrevibacter kandeliae TaxID=2968473 RepID=UPI002118C7BF|nr:Uma2 family endonuclease [Aurantimonas sp. CSK15Z-1]MCQ8780804.1 Uma2 family endonuclease [Aurantimonas sp. CSK15Z-1]
MNQHAIGGNSERWNSNRFLEMVATRPREERWQLVDGVPFMMMSPATGKHQRIVANLDRRLASALERHHPHLDVLREVGLAVPSHPDFLPIADLAIVPADVGDTVYFQDLYLAAEVLSPSKTREEISRKRALYAAAPTCLYVLIIAQADIAVEVWSRADDWQGRIFRSRDDRIVLPDLGLDCAVADLYAHTDLA